MYATVTENGLLIPKELLEGLTEVEIRRENGHVLILPHVEAEGPVETEDEEDYPPTPDDDPIFNFGKNPIDIGITDASVNLDHYLYK